MTGPGIFSYSTTPANNVTANTGINWDEGMSPAAVNNSARQNMTDMRNAFNDLIWFRYGKGDLDYSPVYVSGTSIKITGIDVTAIYHVGRRLKIVGSGTGTIYGYISASSFSTDTTVTIVFDSGSLTNETLVTYISQIPVTGVPVPALGTSSPLVSWTPVLKFGGATTGITYGTQIGKYKQLTADTYWISLQIVLTSKGSASGAATITGALGTPNTNAVLATFGDAIILTGELQAKIVSGASTIFLYALGTGTAGAVQDTNCTNTSEFSISGIYTV